MTSILHATSPSYTEFGNKTGKIGRGLIRGTDGNPVPPDELAVFVATEKKLVLRQTVGVLDKIIRKRRYLRQMTYDAYVHRAKLAERIWQELLGMFRKLDVPLDEADLKQLRERWINKAHPYQLHEPKGFNPEADGNAQFLMNREMENAAEPFAEFQGKWFSEFWAEGGDPTDYRKIAKAAIHHLFVQERLLKGGPREKRDKKPHEPTKVGLMKARGTTAAESASDPRNPSKKLGNDWDLKSTNWYFRNDDVAAEIHASLAAIQGKNDRINAQWFGTRLYVHFRHLGGLPDDTVERRNLWNFHNAVRDYYKDIATSERFRRAVRIAANGEADEQKREQAKLLAILPKDKHSLIGRLAHANLPMGSLDLGSARGDDSKSHLSKGNADLSQAIRLGKLVIHAADAVADEERSDKQSFEDVLAELATSRGQSEIKRLETNARVWRKATALSLRTLKALVDPKGVIVREENDRDIAQTHVAAAAHKNLNKLERDDGHLSQHIGVIWGNKEFEIEGTRISRASIIVGAEDPKLRNENLWAMMRLAARVRNTVFHFNVRRRLLSVLRNGLLEISETQQNDKTRHTDVISRSSASALQKLLSFDLTLQKIAVEIELEQLKAHRYVDVNPLKEVVKQLSREAASESLTLPRFWAVAAKVQNLEKANDTQAHPDLAPLATLVVGNNPGADDPANLCRVGLYRLLYSSGFRSWLASMSEDEPLFSKTVEKIITSKNQRTYAAQHKDGRKTPTVSEMVEHLKLENFTNIEDLLNALAAEAMKSSGQNQKYDPNRKVQKNIANEIEAFKQEFVAHLFAKYLTEEKLDWIGKITNEIEPTQNALNEAMEAYVLSCKKFDKAWHSQFYAWLYLVPPEEASMLRHQMRKSIALESKADADFVGEEKPKDQSAEDAVSMLSEMDQLIGLYTKVQSVGFKGDEHVGALRHATQLYEDPERFKKVYSDDPDTHDQSLAGTRRGLRQLVRFAHLNVLSPVFKNHLVTDGEVEAFTSMSADNNTERFEEYFKLRADILKAENSGKPQEDKRLIRDKPLNIVRYKQVAVDVCKHNFDVNAARLADHVRLHRMMMQLIGRLTDYTSMWERDRLYALVGLLCKRSAENASVEAHISDISITLKIQLPNKEIKVDVYSERNGFDAANFKDLANELQENEAKVFRRLFIELDEENPLDKQARLDAERENRSWRDWPPAKDDKRKAKKKIRNDLAHQNVLDGISENDWRGLQLTYLVNAVRSLMAYDRKQKNVIPKSIKRILGEYGLCIDWRMSGGDRLTSPCVTPSKETHLAFCYQKKGEDIVRFDMPKASPRFVSMAQSLFDFGHSGYTEKIKDGKQVVGRKIWYSNDALKGYVGEPMRIRMATNRKFYLRNTTTD